MRLPWIGLGFWLLQITNCQTPFPSPTNSSIINVGNGPYILTSNLVLSSSGLKAVTYNGNGNTALNLNGYSITVNNVSATFAGIVFQNFSLNAINFGNAYLSSCQFGLNNPYNTFMTSILNASASLVGCSISMGSAIASAPLFTVTSGNLTFTSNMNLQGLTMNPQYPVISLQKNSILNSNSFTMSGSSISNLLSANGSVALLSGLTLSNNFFTAVPTSLLGVFAMISGSMLNLNGANINLGFINNPSFQNNSTQLFSTDSTSQAILQNCIFNAPDAFGNALTSQSSFIIRGVISVTQSQFTNIALTFQGIGSNSITIASTTFIGCRPPTNGAIFNMQQSSTLALNYDGFTSNGMAPVLFNSTGSLSIVGTQFIGHQGYLGGAVYIGNANNVSILRSVFRQNSASKNGGALYINNQGLYFNVTIGYCTFQENVAAQLGGGILFGTASKVNMQNNLFDSNQADRGGGLYIMDPTYGVVSEFQDEYSSNSATTQGPDKGSNFSSITFLSPSSSNAEWLSGNYLTNIAVTASDLFGQQVPSQPLPVVMSLEIYTINNTNQNAPPLLQPSPIIGYFVSTPVVTFSPFYFYAWPGFYNMSIWRLNYDSTKNSLLGSLVLDVPQCSSLGPQYSNYTNGTGIPSICHQNICPLNCSGNGVCGFYDTCYCNPNFEMMGCDETIDFHDSISVTYVTVPLGPVLNSINSNNDTSAKIFQSQLSSSLTYDISTVLNNYLPDFYDPMLRVVSFQDNQVSFKMTFQKNGIIIEGQDLNIVISTLEMYPDQAFPYYLNNTELLMDMDEAKKVEMGTDSPYGIASVVLVSAGLLFTTLLMAFVWYYRDTPTIRLSDPKMSLLTLLGVGLIQCRVIFSLFQPNQVLCSLKLSSTVIGFGFFLGFIVTKMKRILYIIQGNDLTTYSHTRIVMESIFVVLGEVFLIVIWVAIDPPNGQAMSYGDQRYWTCSSGSVQIDDIFSAILTGYNSLLVMMCIYFTIQTRRCWAIYNEYENLASAIYITAVFSVAGSILETIEMNNLLGLFLARNCVVIAGTMLAEYVLLGRRVVSARSSPTTVAASESIEQKELVLDDYMEEVELKSRFSHLSFLGVKPWKKAVLIMTRKRIVAVYSEGKMVAHFLEQMRYKNKSTIIPNSFLLFDNRIGYWIRVKDNESFTQWDDWFYRICSQGIQETNSTFLEN